MFAGAHVCMRQLVFEPGHLIVEEKRDGNEREIGDPEIFSIGE
jgi:hypothetical protein